MPLTTEGRNDLLTNALAAFTHLGLLDESATELTGGSYARQAILFDAASSGQRIITDAESIPVPGGLTAAFAAVYDALSAGNEEGYCGLGTSLARGIGTVEADDDALTAKAHGLVNGNRVHVYPVQGAALPTGLSARVPYFVVSAATDSFDVSLTLGGASVNITADGRLAWEQTKPETFGSDGSVAIPDGNGLVDATVI